MKCAHCGGNIGIEDKVCPYCGEPNLQALQHQEDMRRYENAFEQTRQHVEERTSRFARLTVPLTLGLIVIVAAIASTVFMIRAYDIGRVMVERDMQKHVDEYEAQINEMIADGDYLLLNAFYQNKNLYYLTSIDGGEMEAYDMVFRASSYYSQVFETLLQRLQPDSYYYQEDRIAGTAEQLADELNRLFSIEKENYYPESCYAEDKLQVIRSIRQQTAAILETYAGFTAEETAQITDVSKAKLQTMLEEKLTALTQEVQ